MLAEKFVADRNMSAWLRKALKAALDRDPIDAANDAELLRAVLQRRVVELAERQSGVLVTRTPVRISKRRLKRPARPAESSPARKRRPAPAGATAP